MSKKEALVKVVVGMKCPSCGQSHTVRHGYNMTKKGRFARRKCQECGTTFYENREAKA